VSPKALFKDSNALWECFWKNRKWAFQLWLSLPGWRIDDGLGI
jgi:hypothetical protein